MSAPVRLVQVAQAPEPASPAPSQPLDPWMLVSGLFLIVAIATGIHFQMQMRKLQKKLRMESFRNQELKKRLDLSLKTMRKMETNPDLVNSREFNLDYLRMRMEEPTFHKFILNQIKVKVRMLVSQALRPSQYQPGVDDEPQSRSQGRQVDSTFDIEYETTDPTYKTKKKRVLFRIQVRLIKLPNQKTSTIIEDVIDCLMQYLSHEQDETWQPQLHGQMAMISWDQKAKPTPLLVLEQSREGSNATPRSRRSSDKNRSRSSKAKSKALTN